MLRFSSITRISFLLLPLMVCTPALAALSSPSAQVNQNIIQAREKQSRFLINQSRLTSRISGTDTHPSPLQSMSLQQAEARQIRLNAKNQLQRMRSFILCNLCTIRNRLPTILLWQNRKIKTPEPHIQNKKVNETRIGLIYLFCIPGIIPGNICLNLTCTLCYALCFSTTAFGVNTRCSLMNVVKPSSLSSRP